MALSAAAWSIPTTFGTVACTGPRETVRSTGLPSATVVPPIGFWPITSPAGATGSFTSVTVPTVRLAATMVLSAAAWSIPKTFGTVTCAGPRETVKSTGLPSATLVPPTGF